MQVSMSKKWDSKPIIDEATGEPLLTARGKPVLKKSYSVLQDDFYRHMVDAGYTDIQRGERGSSEEHLTVTQFKVQKEQERLAQIQEAGAFALAETERLNREKEEAEDGAKKAQTKLNHVAPMLKNMEKLAAEFSDDPEKLLPEAGTLETAKSYREKKAKPIFEKIVKVLRSVYRAYQELRYDYNRLKDSYQREVRRSGTLSTRLDEVLAERNSLREEIRDYDRVKRAFGPEQVEAAVEAAKQREAAEKARKRPRRSFDRGGR